MRLYVMRHGPAEDRAPSGRDFDRALTAEGKALVRRVGHAFRASVNAAPRVLSSPRRRARETAEIVAGALGLAEDALELCDELDGEDRIPLALPAQLRAGGHDVLLVGHQPHVEALVRALILPERPRVPLAFRTATIATVIAAGEGWSLDAVLDPDRLPG